MITPEQLSEIGFKSKWSDISPYTGKSYRYHLSKENLKILLTLDNPFLTIEIENRNSYTHTNEQVFKGRCEDFEFLKLILKACCDYF
jgi:hypothetical protein